MAGFGRETKQTRAIAALLSASSIEAAAALAGVPERTLRRWLAEDEAFGLELRNAQNALLSEHVAGLAAALTENRKRLVELRDGAQSESVQLRAAIALDDALQKWLQFAEFEQRLAALEAGMNTPAHDR